MTLQSQVTSYLFNERPDIKTYVDVTNKWWNEERGNFDIWTSDETLAEISQGEYQNKEKILKFISGIEVLPFDDEIIEDAQIYLKNYVIPQKLVGDGIHLASASISKIDAVLYQKQISRITLKVYGIIKQHVSNYSKRSSIINS